VRIRSLIATKRVTRVGVVSILNDFGGRRFEATENRIIFCDLLFGAATSAAPEVGDLAPDWTLPGSDGNEYRLSDLLGKHVVIAFFPKAYTSG